MIKKESFIRRWIKNIIKEAFFEERIDSSMVILSNRLPGHEDYQYKIGAVWETAGERYVLEEISANWKKIKNENRS